MNGNELWALQGNAEKLITSRSVEEVEVAYNKMMNAADRIAEKYGYNPKDLIKRYCSDSLQMATWNTHYQQF
ncbi:MAG: hypothetical protein J6Y87_09240, partial [Muribaculaceae bacterium]|nr:hypothetical protein [Muribaculaceae bacterium]